MRDNLDARDRAGSVHSHYHVNLSAVAGGGHLHHISVGGFVDPFHQTGFIREGFQLLSQLHALPEDPREGPLRLFPLGCRNGPGSDGIHQSKKASHDGGDEK